MDVTIDHDAASILVDVNTGPNRDHTEIPYHTGGAGVWVVPEQGDIAIVESIGSNKTIARGPASASQYSLPGGVSPGDVIVQLADQTYLHMEETDSGVNVELRATDTMNIRATDIFIGEEGNTKKVATEDHAHDFTYDGGGENSGTLSGTTGGPDDTTDHEME